MSGMGCNVAVAQRQGGRWVVALPEAQQLPEAQHVTEPQLAGVDRSVQTDLRGHVLAALLANARDVEDFLHSIWCAARGFTTALRGLREQQRGHV